MRAATLVRIAAVVMFAASIGVAGTTVVMNTASTVFGQVELDSTAEGPQLQAVQADQLERQLRSYQVRLAGDGSLNGRINVIDPRTGAMGTAQEMTIALLQDGNVVHEVHPGLEGKFQVSGVQPGVYSVVGSGPDGYVAYAMQVLPAELTVDNRIPNGLEPVAFQEVQDELAIDSVAVPTSDLPTIVTLAETHIPAELLQEEPSGTGFNPAESIAEQYHAENPLNREDVALAGHQVRIQPDGRLTGRVHRLDQNGEPTRIRRLNVFLVQNNQVVGQAPVDELGTFNFYDVADGVYSFVAAGVEGMAAFTMQAISGPELTGVADELILPVSTNAGMAGAGVGGVVGGADLGYAFGQAQGGGGQGGTGGGTGATGEAGTPGGEGSGSGGGGTSGAAGDGTAGGGAAGTGESGLAELLAAGALIAGAVALSEDDGRGQPISPANPGGRGVPRNFLNN